MAAIEELAGMDILCSDKTGTLTKNTMTLSTPFVINNFTENDLYYYGALASKKENADPIELPIFEYIQEHDFNTKINEQELLRFIPFDPVRKRTEGIYKTESNNLHVIKGATQVILSLCDVSKEIREEIEKHNHAFALKGFRSLGVAYKYSEEKEIIVIKEYI